MSAAIRLYAPDAPPPAETTAPITMREALPYHFERLTGKGKPLVGTTRSRYLNAVGHWERCTDDPPLSEVTTRVVVRFQRRALSEPTARGELLNPQTVDTICRHLRPLVRVVGPAPYGEGLIDALPLWPTVGKPGKAKRKTFLEPDVRAAMYHACRVATRPLDPVPAPLWWRTLFAFLESYGWRPSDLCHGTGRNATWRTGLSWDEFDLAAGTVFPTLQKTGRGADKEEEEFVVPLTPPVVAHLAEFRRFRGTGRLFAIDEQAFYRQLAKIREAAGVERCDPYDWRHTTNTEWQRCTADRLAGENWLGHEPTSVNARHYTADLILLREQMTLRTWLPEFAAAPSTARQQLLF